MQIKLNDFDLTPTVRGFRTVNGFTVNGTRMIQESGSLRGDFVNYFDRKNHKTTIAFGTTHEHDTAEKAAAWCLQLDANCPTQGLAEFTVNAGNGYYRFWLANAVIPQVNSAQKGMITTHAFQILGGQLLTKKPS